MKFIKYTDLKKFEKQYPKTARKALFQSTIIGTTLASVTIVLESGMSDLALFTGLVFGVLATFLFYSTTLYQSDLLSKLGELEEEEAKEEVNV